MGHILYLPAKLSVNGLHHKRKADTRLFARAEMVAEHEAQVHKEHTQPYARWGLRESKIYYTLGNNYMMVGSHEVLAELRTDTGQYDEEVRPLLAILVASYR